MFGWIALIVIVGIVLFIWSKRSGGWFGKFGTSASAQMNKLGDAAIEADPLAVMNLENERDAQTLREQKPKMDKLRGQVIGMQNDTEKLQADIAKLENQLNYLDDQEEALRAKGDTSGADELVAQYSVLDTQLQEKQKELAETLKATKALEAQWESAKEAVQTATQRVAANQEKAKNLGRRLENSQIVREAQEIGRSVAATDFSSIGNATSKAEQILEQQINTNMAAAEVDEVFARPANSADEISKKIEQQMSKTSAADRLAARRAARKGTTPSETAAPAAAT